VGTHYRSAIFFNDLNEKNIVKAYIQKLENETYKSAKIVTELKEFEIFYEAEDYHKNYFELNKVQPYCHIVISPKVEKFKKIYKERLKKD
jgi:peptide-methionine (S)-S-oxide reductase